MGIGDLFSGLGINFGTGTLASILWIVLCSLVAFMVVGFIFWIIWRWKKWNLKVEFKIPRGITELKEDEEINPDDITGFINGEWGKGGYMVKKGVVYVKRKGLPKSYMKPFNIKRYIQGRGILTVIQVAANKYVPVLPESYLQMVDDETGEEAALLKVKMDTSESLAWRNSFEREAKSAYSIASILREYAPWISIGLVIFLWGLQFLILYMKIT